MSWLTGAQHERLRDAFLKAFNYDELEQMVRTKLDKNLEAIILGRNLEYVVYYLIGWADRVGRIEDLLEGALEVRAGNDHFRTTVGAICGELSASGPAPAVAPEVPEPAARPNVAPAVQDEDASGGRPIYVDRKEDRDVLDYLTTEWGTVTVKGHSQVGRTLFLARLRAWATELKRDACVISLRGGKRAMLESTEALCQKIARDVAGKLRLRDDALAEWDPSLDSVMNLSEFIKEGVLGARKRRVLLMFDDADLVFPYTEAPRICSAPSAPGTTRVPRTATVSTGDASRWWWRTQLIRPSGSPTFPSPHSTSGCGSSSMTSVRTMTRPGTRLPSYAAGTKPF